MDALVNVLLGEVLILHCHEKGDCPAVALRASSELSQSADCQSVRSLVWSELLQSAGDCQSRTLTRFLSELQRYSCKSSDKSQVGRRTKKKICRRSHKYLSIQEGETSAKIDSQRFTTETRWIIVRTQILQRLSQRAMLPRKRASEMNSS